MTNDLTTPNTTTPALSAEDLDLMKGAAPTADFKREDLLIPFLMLVQSTSAYLVRGSSDYVDAARPGDILDTLTKEPRQRVAFVPCKFENTFTEWKPNRGGLVKAWGADRSRYDASGSAYGTRTTPDGNDIVPSATYYGLLVFEDGQTMPVVLNMTGSQFKKSRRLNSLIDMLEVTGSDGNKFTPPMYSRVYSLESVAESNDLGNWFGWKVEPGAMLLQVDGGKAVFQKAIKLREQLDEGTARAAPVPGAEQHGVQTGRSQVDDVPF